MSQIEFENLLRRTIGLDTASIGSAAVQRAVQARMAQAGVMHPEDYWQQLQDSNEELQELIETVVVPETWFFRDAQAFAALGRLLIAQRRPATPDLPIRVLSVPCATGEEPYSIVMGLLDGGFPPRDFSVDAVDISERSLTRARNGVYGSNSFRGENLGFRDRYFLPKGQGYMLSERLRGCVNFYQKNLLSPTFGLRDESYDAIFCRNLLIYFDRSTQEQAIAVLGRLLTPAGFLFVGPAEAFLVSGNGFTSVNQAMSFAFRKTGTESSRSALSPSLAGRTAKDQMVVRHKPRATPKLVPKPVSPAHSLTSKAPVLFPAANLATARRLADAGMLEEAAALCEALAANGPSPEAYYILGLVQDARGDRESAAACYQKAIYLQPEHEEALTHLALIKQAHGDSAAARRLLDRASRVAGTLEGSRH